MRPAWTTRLILLLNIAVSVPVAAGGDDLASLVAAERAFARTSVETDVREAFLAFLAEDAVLFRPGPVPGRAWTEDRPAPPVVLSWEPVAAEVSRAGDLGYTTGPWTIRSRDGSRPPAHGQYFSVWRRQADGTWKVIVDVGTNHPAPDAPTRPWEPGEAPAHWTPAEGETPDPATAKDALLARDRELARAAAADTREAYLAHLTTDARLLRNGRPPALGRAEAREVLAEHGSITSSSEAAGVAASGDLGYTWGAYEEKPAEEGAEAVKGHYLRLWRREPDGTWRLAVDLLTPLPPPPPPAAEG